MASLPILDPRTQPEEWLEARRKCISGSDIAAILGLNRWRGPIDVWRHKCGLEAEPDQNEAMEWGLRLEEPIAAKFAEAHGVEVLPSKFYLHPDEPIFGSTPDFEIGSDRLLEIKAVGLYNAHEFEDEGSDKVPARYHLQCQWQLFVTGRQVCHLAVLIGGQKYREYEIPRHDQLIETCAHRARLFMHEYVLADCPPPLDGSASADEWLKDLHPVDDGSVIHATPETIQDLHDLREAIVRQTLAEKEVDILKQRVKAAMGSASVLESPDFPPVTHKAQSRKTTDWKRLAIAHQIPDEEIEDHTKETTYRVLRLPFKADR